MTEQPPEAARWDALAVYFRYDVLIVILLGFSAGLPLALSGSTLLIWMTESGVDLKTIGLFAAVGTPYTLKFLWAPVIDAWNVPLLWRLFGRRRAWLFTSQLLLMAAILFLAIQNPQAAPWFVALGAVLVAFASATQDIVIDAYRVEKLQTDEQAAGVAGYVAAYRVGMLVAGAGALYIVEGFERLGGLSKQGAWTASYTVMALLVGIGLLTTLAARRPAEQVRQSDARLLGNVLRSAYQAFAEFLTRDNALAILGFILFFKFCDAFAGAMTAPFVIDIGFSRVDYANYVKGVGLAATLIGGFVGGYVAKSLSLATSLWLSAILQMLSNLVFAWLALVGKSQLALATAITIENFTGAIGGVIFIAYMSSLCRNPLYTATQYALLSAFMAVGRTYLSMSAGYLASYSGWFWFFVLSCLTALPGLMLLAFLQAKGELNPESLPQSRQ